MQPKIQSRLVISSVNCHITEILQYFDLHLQPEVQELESYVKDSTDFLKKVFKVDKVPKESFFGNHGRLFALQQHS